MHENVKAFLDKISKDQKLKEQCLDLYRKKQYDEIEKISQKMGTPCTRKDFNEAFKNQSFKNTVSDEDLVKIAAGGKS